MFFNIAQMIQHIRIAFVVKMAAKNVAYLLLIASI